MIIKLLSRRLAFADGGRQGKICKLVFNNVSLNAWMVIAKLFIWLVIASEVITSIIDEESIFIAMNLYFLSACLRFIQTYPLGLRLHS